jgi:hypothetical protein
MLKITVTRRIEKLKSAVYPWEQNIIILRKQAANITEQHHGGIPRSNESNYE